MQSRRLCCSSQLHLPALRASSPADDWDCYRPAQLNLLQMLQRHAAADKACYIVITGDYHYRQDGAWGMKGGKGGGGRTWCRRHLLHKGGCAHSAEEAGALRTACPVLCAALQRHQGCQAGRWPALLGCLPNRTLEHAHLPSGKGCTATSGWLAKLGDQVVAAQHYVGLGVCLGSAQQPAPSSAHRRSLTCTEQMPCPLPCHTLPNARWQAA